MNRQASRKIAASDTFSGSAERRRSPALATDRRRDLEALLDPGGRPEAERPRRGDELRSEPSSARSKHTRSFAYAGSRALRSSSEAPIPWREKYRSYRRAVVRGTTLPTGASRRASSSLASCMTTSQRPWLPRRPPRAPPPRGPRKPKPRVASRRLASPDPRRLRDDRRRLAHTGVGATHVPPTPGRSHGRKRRAGRVPHDVEGHALLARETRRVALGPVHSS
jgi:hypothetical protein